MSTFDGFVREFPDIRIDYFRHQSHLPPALACFLSHVHSDHLAGLESFRGPFIYCSAATREILLRLEKAAIRLNRARGIFEDPKMQTYKHLEKLLKPIPLDTPTTLELQPGHTIQITLLDANHCIGAVMFLIEGDGKAVLYTGDIRCEPRFVTTITQNPNMIQYTSGLKLLDCVYLDTSVLRDYPMQTKAQGLRELLEKIRKYPPDTVFHFQAWTYGYEEVWIALSKALNSKIHVDSYKMGIFSSLVTKPKDNRWAAQTHLAKEAPALAGFTCGNNLHEGCLTRDENVRIHSCEKGMGCSVIDNKPFVQILPIVAHLKNGEDMMEVGIGGGGEDLAQVACLTLEEMFDILELLSTSKTMSPEVVQYTQLLKEALNSGRDMSIIVNQSGAADDQGIGIAALLQLIAHKADLLRNPAEAQQEVNDESPLPRVIRFPYARHSSLPELRDFVGHLKPKNIVPCTFNADNWLEQSWSIRALFGDCCTSSDFEYDAVLMRRAEELVARSNDGDSQQAGVSSFRHSSPIELLSQDPYVATADECKSNSPNHQPPNSQYCDNSGTPPAPDRSSSLSIRAQKRQRITAIDEEWQDDSQTSNISDRAYEIRKRAFEIASANILGDEWVNIGLLSTTDHHTTIDQELGSR
ncbi:hypothetical protein F5Y16DRAFT_289745 [Xylariaceae sp. FL0255]|nr:hypothetical protein F5Y16DRAFT_289745 [Xylariaceae sp. FL0255]